MAIVRANISVSADGYSAGPEQSVDNPLGIGGEALHEWATKLKAFRQSHGSDDGEVNASSPIVERILGGTGATVMGRNMFGGGPGEWPEPAWNGWWGDEPPYHHPVFVLTHHPRGALQLEGGTVFNFVTDGPESAVEQAKAAAGELDVSVGGGASTVQQLIAARLLDEIWVTTTPVLLGGGTRLFDPAKLGGASLQQIDAVADPDAVHALYRIS